MVAASPTSRLRPRPVIRPISRALQWHYSDAPGGGAEMARAGAPPCARAAANIAAAAGYSGRGRRPAPRRRLRAFSANTTLQHTIFLRTNIDDVNVRALFSLLNSFSGDGGKIGPGNDSDRILF